MISVTNKSRTHVVIELSHESIPGYTVRGRKVPQTVTLQPGEMKGGLPDVVATLSSVVAGRRSGKLSIAFEAKRTPTLPPEPAPKAAKSRKRKEKKAEVKTTTPEG